MNGVEVVGIRGTVGVVVGCSVVVSINGCSRGV